MLKSELRTFVTQRADSVGSGRWDLTPGAEADRIITGVCDREWRGILNANRYYRFAHRTPTSDAVSGRYLVSNLSTAGERFYRILSVVIDDYPYKETQFNFFPTAETNNSSLCVWWREGDNIFALPKQLSKQADFYVNHIPTRFDGLATESTAVIFPDGYEQILADEGAAELLLKGGVETQAAMELKASAMIKRADMLADIARTSTNPLSLEHADESWEWAGS